MTPESEARRAWAYGLIRRAKTPPPRYGTSEWLALPDGPEKVAAVVIAAESWAFDGDWLEQRLAIELEYAREAFKAAEDAAYVARRDDHRESWTGEGFASDPAITADVVRGWEQWIRGDAA